MIRKSFKFLNKHSVKLLYKSLVRPHLEFASSAWSPSLVRDKNELEKVQRRATKMVPELANLSNEKRSKSLGFTDLTTRRTRGDLIQIYKLMNKLEKVNFVNDLNYAPNSSLVSGGYNLRTQSSRTSRDSQKLPRET